ncbi:MAG: helix-turn-helix domain-containing protein [Catenulispora sp.]|nr:helix-turn-helix domain-containing protein [Catenulispora sp.]
MHNPDIKARTIAMCRAGVPNAEIARKLNIPYGTVGHWKFNDRARHPDLYPALPNAKCPICLGSDLAGHAYSYLLGQYLGDGHIISKPRNHHLAITCCDDYPMIKFLAESTMRDTLPGASTSRAAKQGCTDIKSYSKHWTCLFPQHGPGMKHTRKIELADWQTSIVESEPWGFIRGLIHSDGCRITNWTEKTVAGQRKRYEYVRYFFTNVSTDIRDLYCWALDMVGVEWRYSNSRNISVARRASVALTERHVGPKF